VYILDALFSFILIVIAFDLERKGIALRKNLFALRLKTSVDVLVLAARANQNKSAQTALFSLVWIGGISIVTLFKLGEFLPLPAYFVILIFSSAASDWYWWRRFIRRDLASL